MKITFFASEKPRERLLAEAFAHGAALRGHKTDIVTLTGDEQVADADMACMVGVKSRQLFQVNWSAGVHTLMFDKGYHRERMDSPIRTWEYWRMAYDAHHPTQQLSKMKCDSKRFDQLDMHIRPWRAEGKKIIFAGASAKYHEFYELEEPTAYAKGVFDWIKRYTRKYKLEQYELVYRPKPTWRNAVPIPGTTYSTRDGTIEELLRDAHVLITHGSNACFEAMLYGVPCIVLGNAVAKSISSDRLDTVRNPPMSSEKARAQLLYNLAHCQWKMGEMYNAEQWDVLEQWIYA